MMPRLSATAGTIVISTHHGITTISHHWCDRSIYMSWCHDYQSLLILPCYLHIMVPRQSVPTDTIVLSTHHGVTTTSRYWYRRAIHTSRCHDYQSPLIRSCYLHVMVPRLSVTTDTAVLSTYHGATTINPYWYYRAIHTLWCRDDQSP